MVQKPDHVAGGGTVPLDTPFLTALLACPGRTGGRQSGRRFCRLIWPTQTAATSVTPPTLVLLSGALERVFALPHGRGKELADAVESTVDPATVLGVGDCPNLGELVRSGPLESRSAGAPAEEVGGVHYEPDAAPCGWFGSRCRRVTRIDVGFAVGGSGDCWTLPARRAVRPSARGIIIRAGLTTVGWRPTWGRRSLSWPRGSRPGERRSPG
jgi:hypothetical protein